MLKFNNFFLAEADNTSHVMTFMRANPPTIGHERVVNHVVDLAKGLDAGHSVILSHSHDGDKNPLTAEQKLRHAKIAFPDANVSTSSPEAPSLMYHASKLYNKGVRNLHLVVGQDRVDQFNKLLSTYNGQEGNHGYYNFDNITVHSAGGRDPDAEGIEGISGTGQRKHAMSNDFDSFRAGAPSRMSDEQAASLMSDIRNGIVPKKPKAKKLKESTTTADARGLGYVSGDPAVDGAVTTNDVDSLFFRGNLKNSIKQSENPLAKMIGFKAFNPDKLNTRDKSLPYYDDDPNGDLLLRDKMRNKSKNNNATRG